MSGKARIVVSLAAGLAVGAAAGMYAGSWLQSRSIVSLWIAANARDVEEVVEALEHLRAGRRDEALVALEVQLNRHLFGLMPETRVGIAVTDEALGRARAAATVARRYRELHPYGGETALDRDVRRFLETP